jgi:hypothetical protein
MQVPQRGHVAASIMLRELRGLLLVPSRLPWVEGARRLLDSEELFVGAAEKYLSLLECLSSLLLAVSSG